LTFGQPLGQNSGVIKRFAIFLVASFMLAGCATPMVAVLKVHCVYKHGVRACFTRAEQPIAAGQELEIVPE